MPRRKGQRLPPRVNLLITVATAVPFMALFWVSWRFLAQDRALEGQQIRQRLERAADIAAAALERAVASSERRLAEESRDWPEGAVVMKVQGKTVQVWPAGRVAYVPVPPDVPELPVAPFGAGERAEFRDRDLGRAAAIYRDLVGSSRPGVRAGALLRLARCLRGSGGQDEALAVYARLLEEDGWVFEGIPVDLVARQARCALMETLNRPEDLRKEASLLGSDLQRGRWLLVRAQARLLAQDAERWGIGPLPGQAERELLAGGLAALFERLTLPGTPDSGRGLLTVGSQSVVALWRRSGDQVTALIAAPRFVSEQWLAGIEDVLSEQRINLTLQDGPKALPPGTVRRTDDTGLPWTAVVTPGDPEAERGEYRARRRLLLSVFLLLAALIVLAGTLISRATSREFAAARMQSDFVSAVSHEFRTPLTSLRQFTDMLREHRTMSDERRDVCLEALARSTDRLTRLVESLLDFGRMEGGARIYHLEPLDAAELVRRVLEEFRAEAQCSEFQFRVAIRGPAEVDADAEALGRAIWNLLDNAVKYSGESREIEVEAGRAGPEVRIEVRDRGLGIPAHERDPIFRKFQRGGDAVRLGIRGTGIGLTMVDHIIKAHRGRVEVRSEPGQGSVFTLVLPARR